METFSHYPQVAGLPLNPNSSPDSRNLGYDIHADGNLSLRFPYHFFYNSLKSAKFSDFEYVSVFIRVPLIGAFGERALHSVNKL